MQTSQNIESLLKLKPYRMYTVFFVGILTIPTLMIIAYNTFVGHWLFENVPINTEITLLLFSLLLVYSFILYLTRTYLSSLLQSFKQSFSIKASLSALIIGALFAILVFFFMAFVPPPESFTDAGLNIYLDGTHYSRLVAIICAVILAPIMEEYLFRAYIFDGLRQKNSLRLTFIATSVLFVLPHMFQYYEYWPAAIILFTLGLILAYFRERYESLLPCIFLHASYNFGLVALTLYGLNS